MIDEASHGHKRYCGKVTATLREDGEHFYVDVIVEDLKMHGDFGPSLQAAVKDAVNDWLEDTFGE